MRKLIACDDSTVTLLSKESFENKAFNSSGTGNDYATSEIKTYVDGLTGEGQPLAGIRSVISDLTLIDITTANGLSVTKKKGAGADWWLCSPGDDDDRALCVNGGSGRVIGGGDLVNYTLGVRPALKLNLSSVIFSSESNTFSLKPSHTHSFTYSASGATITATCSGEDCDITTGLTLTISAPTGDLTADGTKTFPATLSTGYNTTAFPEGSISEISYAKDGDSTFTGTPTEAGTYTASVTVGDATASVSYTVNAAAQDLADAKTTAKGDLDTLLAGKNQADYDAADWTTLTQAIADGKDAIDAATTTDAVDTAKADAVAAVNAIKTKDQKAAGEVITKISALPDFSNVTTANKDAIEAARTTYNALTNDQKALVSADTLKKLTDAEDKLVIIQVMSEVSAKTGSGMTYTGSPIQLVNTPTTALPEGYTMKYAVTTENVAPTDDSLYTTSNYTATDAVT